jgi:hypothetical protein
MMANEKRCKKCGSNGINDLVSGCEICDKAPEPTGDDNSALTHHYEPDTNAKGFCMCGFNAEASIHYRIELEPKAPTGDDRATPWVRVPHLPGYEWRLNSEGYRETRPIEPKAPDVIEVELRQIQREILDSCLKRKATGEHDGEQFAAIKYALDECVDLRLALKAEIAAKNSAKEVLFHTYRTLEKAEKERDAALAEVERVRNLPAYLHIVDIESQCDQLQRDMDAAKELLKEYEEIAHFHLGVDVVMEGPRPHLKHQMTLPLKLHRLFIKVDNLLK